MTGARRAVVAGVALTAALASAAVAAGLGVTAQRLTAVRVATGASTTTTSGAPPVTVTFAAAADAYIDSDSAGQDPKPRATNFGGGTTLSVQSSNGNDEHRSLARFALAGIPAGAAITSANLRLVLLDAPGQSRTYDAYRVTQDWCEKPPPSSCPATTLPVTDQTQPARAATATASVATGTTDGVTLSWAVTADVAAFHSGASTNFGWVVQDRTQQGPTNTGTFGAREHATVALRPTLSVTYQP